MGARAASASASRAGANPAIASPRRWASSDWPPVSTGGLRLARLHGASILSGADVASRTLHPRSPLQARPPEARIEHRVAMRAVWEGWGWAVPPRASIHGPGVSPCGNRRRSFKLRPPSPSFFRPLGNGSRLPAELQAPPSIAFLLPPAWRRLATAGGASSSALHRLPSFGRMAPTSRRGPCNPRSPLQARPPKARIEHRVAMRAVWERRGWAVPPRAPIHGPGVSPCGNRRRSFKLRPPSPSFFRPPGDGSRPTTKLELHPPSPSLSPAPA